MPDFPSDYVAPASREETVTSLRVTGTIPQHLDGRYVRTGPNPLPGQFDPDNYSIFGLTGDGMVHGVRLRDGNAEWYRSRWVRAPHVSRLLGEKPVTDNGQPTFIPRNGPAAVRWFDIDPCYVFHTLNAYEEDGAVVCDAVRIEGPTGKPEYDVHEVLDVGQPRLNRWTIDLATGAVKESLLNQRTQEFPMVDPRRIGRKHTYGYTVAFEENGPHDLAGSVLRYDLGADKTSELPLPPGHLPGEFSAIPASPDAPEQDGLLMGFTYDRANGVSNLLILEASTLTRLAEVHLPARVPFLFHGNWLPAN